MAKPTEHITVQARILEYAEAIHLRDGYGGQVGWTFVSQKEAEKRRGIGDSKLEIGKGSLFFEALLDANPSSPIGYAVARVREFNPRYAEAEGALPSKFPPSLFSVGATGRHFSADIYGNRELVEPLRNRGNFFDHDVDEVRLSYPHPRCGVKCPKDQRLPLRSFEP